jgi:hypothetical protein
VGVYKEHDHKPRPRSHGDEQLIVRFQHYALAGSEVHRRCSRCDQKSQIMGIQFMKVPDTVRVSLLVVCTS